MEFKNQSIIFWDPYDLTEELTLSEILNKRDKDNNILILGPIASDNKRYFFNFQLTNTNKLKINSTESYYTDNYLNNFNYKHIDLESYDKEKMKIKEIQKSRYYTGAELVSWSIQISKCLGFSLVFLEDLSRIKCFQRPDFFKEKNDFPRDIISLLKKGETYYETLYFNLIDKTTFKKDEDDRIKINKLLSNLKKISFDEIQTYLEAGIKTIDNPKKQELYFNMRIYNNKKWENYWNNVYQEFLKFKKLTTKKYNIKSPFQKIESYNNDECGIYLNWLELYSITYHDFSHINKYKFINFNNEGKTIPGFNEIQEIKELLRNKYWGYGILPYKNQPIKYYFTPFGNKNL